MNSSLHDEAVQLKNHWVCSLRLIDNGVKKELKTINADFWFWNSNFSSSTVLIFYIKVSIENFTVVTEYKKKPSLLSFQSPVGPKKQNGAFTFDWSQRSNSYFCTITSFISSVKGSIDSLLVEEKFFDLKIFNFVSQLPLKSFSWESGKNDFRINKSRHQTQTSSKLNIWIPPSVSQMMLFLLVYNFLIEQSLNFLFVPSIGILICRKCKEVVGEWAELLGVVEVPMY